MAGVLRIECVNHPGREGVGVCVTCKKTICIDCSSRLQNILYCRKCLEREHVAISKTSLHLGAALVSAAVIFSGFAVTGKALAVLGRKSRALYAEYVHWTSYGGE